ncbi:MAG: hypothetical protein ABJF50_13280 [Paracoccaceae bacterium]
MNRPPRRTYDDPIVVRTSKKLLEVFPKMSSGHAALCALQLTEAPDWSEHLRHKGAEDRDYLAELVQALDAARANLASLSPWIVTGLETAMHKSYVNSNKDMGDIEVTLPVQKDEIDLVLKEVALASMEADTMRQSWRGDHGKNWRAIALIDEARKIWEIGEGRPAPPKATREERKFAQYLKDIFECVGVSADVRNAYTAWSEVAYDPRSPLQTPGD